MQPDYNQQASNGFSASSAAPMGAAPVNQALNTFSTPPLPQDPYSQPAVNEYPAEPSFGTPVVQTDQPEPDSTPPADNQFTSTPPVVSLPEPLKSTDDSSSSTSSDDKKAMPPANDEPANLDNLADIKHQALEQLSPLVEKLDQTAEEKFRTTMMMIQATDDHKMVAKAYEAAQEIEDDKARAQALLDIVNEINYFTQEKS